MPRLRALHLVHDSPRISEGCGGTERYVHALAEATGDPVLTRRRSGDGEVTQEDGVYPLWILNLGLPDAPRFRDSFAIPQMDAALDRVLREEEVDVVHVHHFAHLGFGLPQGAFAHGKPVLFHLHDYHSICVRGQLVQRDLHRCEGPQESRCASCVLEHLRARPSLHFAGKLADRVGLRTTARNLVAVGNPREPDLRQIRARFQASQVAFSKIDRFLSPSQDLAQRMSEAGWAPSDRIFVEDLPLVQPIRPRKAKAQGPLRFLFVGSLIPTKGPQVLLEAAKDLACEVRFYGPAPSFDGRPQWGEELIAKKV